MTWTSMGAGSPKLRIFDDVGRDEREEHAGNRRVSMSRRSWIYPPSAGGREPARPGCPRRRTDGAAFMQRMLMVPSGSPVLSMTLAISPAGMTSRPLARPDRTRRPSPQLRVPVGASAGERRCQPSGRSPAPPTAAVRRTHTGAEHADEQAGRRRQPRAPAGRCCSANAESIPGLQADKGVAGWRGVRRAGPARAFSGFDMVGTSVRDRAGRQHREDDRLGHRHEELP
jgi:hypothetical protein